MGFLAGLRRRQPWNNAGRACQSVNWCKGRQPRKGGDLGSHLNLETSPGLLNYMSQDLFSGQADWNWVFSHKPQNKTLPALPSAWPSFQILKEERGSRGSWPRVLGSSLTCPVWHPGGTVLTREVSERRWPHRMGRSWVEGQVHGDKIAGKAQVWCGVSLPAPLSSQPRLNATMV